MRALQFLLIVALLGFGAHWWKERSSNNAIRAVTSQNGFVPVPMPTGAKRNTVLIFTPLNCPREGAQRANALSQRLTELGIPNVKTSLYEAQADEPTPEQLAAFKRLNVVMTGEIPIALINGMGKANPTIEEVVSEYKRTR